MTVTMGGADVAAAAASVGFKGDALVIAVAVARAESSWQRDKISATNDYGLWQINKGAWGKNYDFNRLLSDANYNAKAAWDISRGGTNWDQWYTYTPLGQLSGTGPFRNYLDVATSAVNFYLGNTGQPTVSKPNPKIGVDTRSTTAVSTAAAVNNATVQRGASCPWPPTLTAQPQKAHDSAFYSGGSPDGYSVYTGGTKQFQGRIIGQDSTTLGLALDFLYNPEFVDMQYAADQSMLPSDQMSPSQMGLGLTTTTTISFTLYFDRSFELFHGSDVSQGVMYDINRLEQICGITEDYPYFILNRVKVLLGRPLSMQYFASITNFSVHYSHFSWTMVPMRAVVQIQMIRLGKLAAGSSDELLSAAMAAGGSGYEVLDTSKAGKPQGGSS
jgi:lysozyme-like protein